MHITILTLGSMASGGEIDPNSYFTYYAREDNHLPITTIRRITVAQPRRGEDDWYFGIGSKLELLDPTPHPEAETLCVKQYKVIQRGETEEACFWEYQHLAKLPAGTYENVAVPIPNVPSPEEVELLDRLYTFTVTPSHGYLHAPVACIQALGITDQITAFSYRRETEWLLEEDVDATTFLNALSERLGKSRHWLSARNLKDVHGNI